METFTIKRTSDLALIEPLHRELFGKKAKLDGTHFWLVWQKGKDYPVGFASARNSTVKGWGFLSRAGVLKEARGHSLQKRLIETRTRWSRGRRHKGILTYVATWNTASIVNLFKCGFKAYDPVEIPKRDGYIYFCKRLKRKA